MAASKQTERTPTPIKTEGTGAGGGTKLVASKPAAESGAHHVQPRRAERRPEMIRQKREQQAKSYERQRQIRQWSRIGGAAIAALIVAGIAWTVFSYVNREPPPGERVSSSAPPAQHIARNEADQSIPPHEEYTSQPPTSGPHLGSEVEGPGVYKESREPERFVHSLEHGYVILQYNCECPETVALLERFANPATGYPAAVITQPWANMETEVALTAWNYVDRMSAAEVTPERIREFIEGHINKGPERIPSQISDIREWREDDDATRPWDVS